MLDLLSYAGMILLLAALIVNRKKPRLSNLMNLIGSICLTIWAVFFGAPAIVILDLVWFIISSIKLFKDVRKCQ